MTYFAMSQEALVRHLKEDARILGNPRLEVAFGAVDRANFVPEKLREEAYADYPLPIGFGQTISQPSTVAFMLEKLDVRPGQKVLDIGSGSGWTTALLSVLVGEKGRVIGLEIIPELARFGQENLAKHYSPIRPPALRERAGVNRRMARNVEIRIAERGVAGLPEEAPFDRILVSAAARAVPPELVKQLSPNGILVMPIGDPIAVQTLVRVTKKPDGAVETEEYPGFVFVPLVAQ